MIQTGWKNQFETERKERAYEKVFAAKLFMTRLN